MTKTRQEICNNRPTSPHLTIYRPQISSVLSIFHRITGIILFVALSISIWCFIFFVFSNCSSNCYKFIIKCNLIKIALVGISFAWFYHLCTGVRHLMWDVGYGFSIRAINITGWIVIICSIIMTLIFWLCIS